MRGVDQEQPNHLEDHIVLPIIKLFIRPYQSWDRFLLYSFTRWSCRIVCVGDWP